jgi:hypothetical protein
MNKRTTSAKPLKTSLLEKALEGQAEVNIALGRLMEKVDRINGLKAISRDLASMPPAMIGEQGREIIPMISKTDATDVNVVDVIKAMADQINSLTIQRDELKRKYEDKDRIAREMDRKWNIESQERRKADLKVADLENVVLTRGEVAIELLKALQGVKAIDITQRFKKRLLKILEGPKR